ncbi:deaminase [Rathayibacter sp. VKM Ac-2759]|uniref:dihydrofolate reductase family protein n=1 Tax=Rathayibacter sp. VKM Ac-2759 TaxID=2609252 RepID=UPI0013174FD9|nr:dihydrofolate reductase family protein [Rathayibacter sp. VKM Ac-2759]QHC65143.1 deaminase [Rathayibacter sp. VKM Ac-2759]
MPDLIHVTNVSLDGFIEDEDGVFAWLPVDDEVFASHTRLMQSVGTLLYGRRLYETMAGWETDPALAAQSAASAEFAAAWRAPSKVVYSRTLTAASTADTRIDSAFDLAAVQRLKAAALGDLLIGGAGIAAQALTAGLVDEIQLYVLPLLVGGGKPGLPRGLRTALDLVEERRFGNGTVLLRYRVRR